MPKALKPRMGQYSADELALCVERELLMREKVYPFQVYNKRMSQDAAEIELGKMVAIRDLLRSLPKDKSVTAAPRQKALL